MNSEKYAIQSLISPELRSDTAGLTHFIANHIATRLPQDHVINEIKIIIHDDKALLTGLIPLTIVARYDNTGGRNERF
jgi:hypothetical protein